MVRSMKQRKGWAGMPTATVAILVLGLVPLFLAGSDAHAAGSAFPLQVAVGQSVVLDMPREVTTVSIADPKVADAAVGSERTVVVNGKSAGTTSLVVWEEGGKYTLYQITCSDPGRRHQVLLKCKITELDNTRMKEFGIDWQTTVNSIKHLDGAIQGGLFVTKVETPSKPLLIGPSTDGFVRYDKSNGDFTFLSTLRALEERGLARVLASPNLVATSGDSASFLAGGEFPVPVIRAASEGGYSYTIQWKEFGVRLQMTPTVLEGNRIRLRVSPEVSTVDYSVAVDLGGAGFPVPGITARRVTTTVELAEGDVLVIGGVKSTTETKRIKKFPILGDIPLLKVLFRHKITDRQDRDLIVAVAPEIVGEMAKTFPSHPGDLPLEGSNKDNGAKGSK